jgi:hypothetical protein
MKIDVISATNSKYIGINPQNPEGIIFDCYGNGIPHIMKIENSNNTHFDHLPLLVNLLEENPDYMLSEFQVLDEDYKKKIITTQKLRDILEFEQIGDLFQAYNKSNNLYKSIKNHDDESSWVNERKILFSGKMYLDRLVHRVQEQIVRQHVTNTFNYTKEQGIPVHARLIENQLNLADETGMSNCGHGAYSFDSFELIPSTIQTQQNKDLILPIQTFELSFLGTKAGTGQYQYDEQINK